MPASETRQLTAPVDGPLVVQVDGGSLHLAVTADPETTTATAVLEAPAAVARAARAVMRRGDTWHLIIPAPPVPSGQSVRITTPAGLASGGPYLPGTVKMTVTVPPGSRLTAQAGPRPPAAGTEDPEEQ